MRSSISPFSSAGMRPSFGGSTSGDRPEVSRNDGTFRPRRNLTRAEISLIPLMQLAHQGRNTSGPQRPSALQDSKTPRLQDSKTPRLQDSNTPTLPRESNPSDILSNMTLEEHYFNSPGLRIRYWIGGEGSPVVLIHGILDSAKIAWFDTGVAEM